MLRGQRLGGRRLSDQSAVGERTHVNDQVLALQTLSVSCGEFTSNTGTQTDTDLLITDSRSLLTYYPGLHTYHTVCQCEQ